MKSILIWLAGCLMGLSLPAQDSLKNQKDPEEAVYRATAPRINDLVHTKLDVRFDYARSWLYGKAWITLKPHFYPTDSLTLDAKGMDIHSIAIVKNGSNTSLKYSYDGWLLFIRLNKTYRNNESYTIYIDYTSKPNELKVTGSAAITDAKGLYFINPLGEEKDKPTQVWTQGETESNSSWFPTIDKPNQKSTEEITMTVPAKYVTLSNGSLISQKKNTDGTRTDYWKMDLPHAPYLFFMGVGPYAVVKDHYKGREVNYYVEPEYAAVARRTFGLTPEMMAFYSRILGIEYPWVKYSQMTARDYVSGAMENTTATLHSDILQQDARQLADGNEYEVYVCHELFHQWFGDLVTTESWSNLTLNESFANYSETLWTEYKHGKDAAADVNYHDVQKYLADPTNPSKDLVRFHYSDKEKMFDMVSYSKGGRILHMLRNYVGDSAFYKALNLYLNQNKFKSAEAQNLRLAFEEVTGQDLNWFWNQWYYGSGHPKFTINYKYDDAAGKATVIVEQTQGTGKIFRIPLAIDLYEGGLKTRHNVWIQDQTDSFQFSYKQRPDLINVDGDKVILCEKKDNKSLANFIYQYKEAGLYMDRREAIDFCSGSQDSAAAFNLLRNALRDRFYTLRIYAMDAIDTSKQAHKDAVEPILFDLAKNDPNRKVQAKAIEMLGSYRKADYKALFEKKVNDSSYSVAGASLTALNYLDPEEALKIAKNLSSQPAKGKLLTSLVDLMIKSGDDGNSDMIINGFSKMGNSQEKFDDLPNFAISLLKVNDTEKVKKGVDAIVKFRDAINPDQKKEIGDFINNQLLKPLADRKDEAGLKDQADYIRSKMQ